MFLPYSKQVQKLEEENNWILAIYQLRKNWESNPEYVEKLISYGMEIWYVLVFYERIKGVKNICLNDLRVELMSTLEFGQRCFPENPYFNAYYGYMIYVMPYEFLCYQGDYDKGLNLGKHMIQKAFEKEPTNPLFAAFYHGSIQDDDARDKDCKALMQNQTQLSNGSVVNDYLFRIFHGDIYCSD